MSVRRALRQMLDELEGNRLEVVLVPQRHFTNSGGMVRVAVSRNAAWYRDFCGQHASRRIRRNAAFDTKVKRQATLQALQALIDERPLRSWYVDELRRIARQWRSQPQPQACRAMTIRNWGALLFGGVAP